MHALVTRLLQQRLQIATGLDGHTLYLECHPPSGRLTAAKVPCLALGSDGLDDILSGLELDNGGVGQIGRMHELYARFRPQRTEPEVTVTYRHPAGDVPGSRTYRESTASKTIDLDDVVSDIVTVDAHDLFSQLTALTYLGKREPSRGLLFSIQEVSEGTIRVWRHWLSRQCESKSWTDGEPVVIHHEAPTSPVSKGKGRADSIVSPLACQHDPSILWVNTSRQNVGIKFRVKERKRGRVNPILFSSDEEVSVSYLVVFEGTFPLYIYKQHGEVTDYYSRGYCSHHTLALQTRRSAELGAPTTWQSHCLWCLPRLGGILHWLSPELSKV